MSEEKEATKITVKDLGFGFVLKFDELPSVEDFCNATISVFQTASMSLMQKEPIRSALEEAGKIGKQEFVFEGQLNHKTNELEVRISVLKEKPKILDPKGMNLGAIPGIIPMNRAERRKK